MKRFVLIATLLSTFLYSCETDFDVTSDWEDIAIVYGLLDPTDTAQYIKINKAFLDKSVSALVIAQNPDSLYYKNIVVQLQQFQNSVLKKTIDLVKPGHVMPVVNYLAIDWIMSSDPVQRIILSNFSTLIKDLI